LAWALWRQNSLPLLGILKGVFLANHLASTDNLTRTTKRQNTYKTQTNVTQNVALINSINTLKKPVLREREQTETGLVACYDIRPGNGAGLFFHTWSLQATFQKNEDN